MRKAALVPALFFLAGFGPQGASIVPQDDTQTIFGPQNIVVNNAVIPAFDTASTPVLNTSTAVATTTLSTTQSGDLVVFLVNDNGGTCSTPMDTAGLVWTARTTPADWCEFWAYASAPLSSDVITSNLSFGISSTVAIAVKGPTAPTPFDSNASLPAENATTAIYSTSDPPSFVFCMWNYAGGPTPAQCPGFTAMASGAYIAIGYQIYSVSQSGVSVTPGTGTNSVFVDVLK